MLGGYMVMVMHYLGIDESFQVFLFKWLPLKSHHFHPLTSHNLHLNELL